MSRYVLISLMCLGCVGIVFLISHKTPSLQSHNQKGSVLQHSSAVARSSKSKSASADSPSSVSLPDAAVADLSGNKVPLVSFEGHPVLVVFWTTWCQPCNKEMAFLQEQAPSLKEDHNMTVIGVNMFTSEMSKTDVSRFVKSHYIHFPVLLDSKDQLTMALNVHTIPTSFLFNKEGKLIATKEGPLETKTLNQLIEKLKLS